MDWKFILTLVVIVSVGCAGFTLLQLYYTNDMNDTCHKCINTCRPQTNVDAYTMCKVCFMSDINGEYLDYKNPTCKPRPPTFIQRAFNLSGAGLV